MPVFSHTIDKAVPGGMRLDRYVAEVLGLLSRSQIKARSLAGKINGKDVKISRQVKTGDFIELSWNEAEVSHLIPENISLAIIYEDGRSVVVNKEQGMVVHPGAGNRRSTLANALYYRRLERLGLPFQREAGDPAAGLRPGIVHRLDKETSGVIIAAYDDEALAFLAGQFKARTVRKTYIAIVSGIPGELKGRIETFIARDPRERKRFAVLEHGRYALTFYKVIKSWQNHSLLLLRPRTGRTHQLRVHLRYLGHPIVGDSVYGISSTRFPLASLMLHAKSLAITLPGESSQRIFTAAMPERFITMIQQLDRVTGHGNA
ncbi:MAG: RluA family pseudouridine synthase [Treponema sp.]|jgi:23S rRNA pseudouridine1911/1915/1917 synthase|nr:RluA family pseudouridine synthase [Treponema sp.]